MADLFDIAVARKLSGGGGGGTLVVDGSTGTLDKTWKEIHDAFLSGGVVVTTNNDMLGMYQNFTVISVDKIQSLEAGYNYNVCIAMNMGDTLTLATFSTSSENGYPFGWENE